MSNWDWPSWLADRVRRGQVAQIVLSRPLSNTDRRKLTLRPIELRGELVWQWTTRAGAQERHENLATAATLERMTREFPALWGDLHAFTPEGDLTVRVKPDGRVKVQRHAASKPTVELSHNQQRSYLLPANQPCPFLEATGILDATGRVRPTQAHKFRQINRYLEFLEDLWADFPGSGPIRVVDFGSGKSALTFALHHWLTALHHREARIIGLDRKAEVMADCQRLAEQLSLRGLTFKAGDIADYQPTEPVDLAISLHACDVATDLAIAAALRWKTPLILAVPCCQHELARLIPDDTLPGLLGYGLGRERFASLATDALRARYLEARGYRTQMLEFIDLEHTPKNVLLRAVRRSSPSTADQARRIADYQQLKQQLGITRWALEDAAGPIEPLSTIAP